MTGTQQTSISTAAPSEQGLLFDDGLFRQRERTIDNIKRIYAVVYSLSFTNVLRDILDYYATNVTGEPQGGGFTAGLWLRLSMLLIFISTISVFALQADKFLDLRYALRPFKTDPTDPMPRWRRGDFALDAVSLIFSLVPFILMSYAFDDKIVRHLGILPFLAAYILLLGLSLFFLQIIRLKFLLSGSGASVDAIEAPHDLTEDVRYGVLSIHWFATNGLLVFLLLGVYRLCVAPQDLCGAASLGQMAWIFIVAFVILSLVRNFVDYWSVWPFLYINRRRLEPQELTGFLRKVVAARPETIGWYDLLGPLSLLAIVWAFLTIGPTLAPDACPKIDKAASLDISLEIPFEG